MNYVNTQEDSNGIKTALQIRVHLFLGLEIERLFPSARSASTLFPSLTSPFARYIEVHPGTRKERESERLSVQDLNQGARPQARKLSWTLSFPTWVNP